MPARSRSPFWARPRKRAIGRRASLVDEDEFAGIEFELAALEPSLAPFQDFGPIPLRRACGLFLTSGPRLLAQFGRPEAGYDERAAGRA
jgi:hypothetical protein